MYSNLSSSLLSSEETLNYGIRMNISLWNGFIYYPYQFVALDIHIENYFCNFLSFLFPYEISAEVFMSILISSILFEIMIIDEHLEKYHLLTFF